MKKIFLLVLVSFLLLPLSALAQWGGAKANLGVAGGKTGLQPVLETSVSTIITGALALIGTIFLILTIAAGIIWMTAQGNEEKVTKAKNIITAAIIGLVITMAAYAITSFVTGRLSGGGAGSSGVSCPSGSAPLCVGKSVGYRETLPNGGSSIDAECYIPSGEKVCWGKVVSGSGTDPKLKP